MIEACSTFKLKIAEPMVAELKLPTMKNDALSKTISIQQKAAIMLFSSAYNIRVLRCSIFPLI